MNIGWEDKIKRELIKDIRAVDFPKERQEEILSLVHRQIGKRRVKIKMNRKRTGIILAAALIVIGSISAVGAGKIAFTSGGHSINDEINNLDELTTWAENKLGGSVRIPESLTEEITFSRGVVSSVDAWDEEHNKVGSFPEAHIYYGENDGKKFSLSIAKPLEIKSKSQAADLSETYQDIEIYGSVDQYLFLPVDQEPSEEQKQLEAEGKLYISYGSDEVENNTFTWVSWYEGSFEYLISTFEDADLSEMMEWAKTVIDCKR